MMLSDSDELHVRIKTSNAAFDGDDVYAETARILRDAADRLDRQQTQAKLHDMNGNYVGYFIWSGRSE